MTQVGCGRACVLIKRGRHCGQSIEQQQLNQFHLTSFLLRQDLPDLAFILLLTNSEGVCSVFGGKQVLIGELERHRPQCLRYVVRVLEYSRAECSIEFSS
jgi:hypothetical protein